MIYTVFLLNITMSAYIIRETANNKHYSTQLKTHVWLVSNRNVLAGCESEAPDCPCKVGIAPPYRALHGPKIYPDPCPTAYQNSQPESNPSQSLFPLLRKELILLFQQYASVLYEMAKWLCLVISLSSFRKTFGAFFISLSVRFCFLK